MKKVIIIGGGPSGVTAALRAVELGASATLIERGRLGGTCTNDGCVPTRVLAKAARLMRDSEDFAAYGLEGERPVPNFERVIAQTQSTVYRIHEKKQIESHMKEAGIDVITNAGPASFLDAFALKLGDGRTLEADRFIISAGGHPRPFSIPGSENTMTIGDVWSMKTLPHRIAIIGGAATGCQLASIFASFGASVTLFEVGTRLLRMEDEIVSEAIRKSFVSHGMNVIIGLDKLERVEKSNEGLRLIYRQASEEHGLETDAIIAAVGWLGNIEQMNLEAIGVSTERNYIKVNDYLQTSVPNIYAAGDITGRMMLVQSGSYEGRIAAENAVLGLGATNKHVIVPHGGFTDPEYGSVGMTEDAAKAAGIEYVSTLVPYADIDRAVIDNKKEGWCKIIVSQETHRILGAHIVGEQALEIIQLVAAGMSADMWIEQLAELELAYPTYTAVLGLAARKIVSDLGVMPMAAQWRAMGKSYASEWERSV